MQHTDREGETHPRHRGDLRGLPRIQEMPCAIITQKPYCLD